MKQLLTSTAGFLFPTSTIHHPNYCIMEQLEFQNYFIMAIQKKHFANSILAE